MLRFIRSSMRGYVAGALRSTAIILDAPGCDVPILPDATRLSQPLPQNLGRYEIEAEIGRGMMGIVYRATDPELHRTVALKTVHLAWAISDEERENFERRFLTEARVAAGLNHPGIVVVHDMGRDVETRTVFIALEFLEGRTLAELAKDGTPMDWRDALRITARVAEALHHAHEKGIVHRDVKPANVMILPSGEPKIMDFGIAKVPTSQLTAAGEFFGTPSYMSPEQAGGVAVDGRSDLFSLGAVLYLLLTGRRAFDAKGVPAILARVAHQDPPEPTRIVPELPKDVDYLVARALAKNPGDRYPDGRSFAEDLSDVLEGRSPRHRAGWSEPRRAEETLLSELVALEPVETEDLRPVRADTARPLPTVRATAGRGHLFVGAAGGAILVGLLIYAWSRGGPEPRGGKAAAASDSEPAQNASASPPDTSERQGLSALWLQRLPFSKAPAHVELRLEHPLKDGTLKVLVDDDVAFERDLGAKVTRKILFYKERKETFTQAFDVPPGDHAIKLVITSGDATYVQRIKGAFKSGQTRRLEASLGGIISKDLALVWGASKD
jgi:predicted Ser/Thr protein kinase